MNQVNLYHRANEVQRADAEQIIKEFSEKLQWRSDGCDALLDIGSGTGDVLMDFIYNIMPKKFEKIVATDISPKMMNYAREYYKTQDKCDFRVLDIGTENDLPKDLREQFDHVTSFYCLHWVHNQRQACQNIFNLLRSEGGDCLLVFLASNPINDAYVLLSKTSKWCNYMKDVYQYISPYQFSKEPKLEFQSLLKEEGFSDIHVEVRHKVHMYEGLQVLKDNVKAICPFWESIPENLHDEFMDDFVNTYSSLGLRQAHHSNEFDFSFKVPYTLFVAYAKKNSKYVKGNIKDMISPSIQEKNFN